MAYLEGLDSLRNYFGTNPVNSSNQISTTKYEAVKSVETDRA